MYRLKFLTMSLVNIWILKFTLKRIWRKRLNSGRGNLFCLMSSCIWVFWANRCSTFPFISYFILKSRQMRNTTFVTVTVICSTLASPWKFQYFWGCTYNPVKHLSWSFYYKNSKPLSLFTKNKPSSLGRRTANFAATPNESRSKFTGPYNPPTLRNITKSKILHLKRNTLVIWSFPHVPFFHTVHLPLLITLHSTERRKHKNNNNTFHHAVPISWDIYSDKKSNGSWKTNVDIFIDHTRVIV